MPFAVACPQSAKRAQSPEVRGTAATRYIRPFRGLVSHPSAHSAERQRCSGHRTFRVLFCRVESWSSRVVSSRVESCRVESRRVVSCRAVSSRVELSRSLPHPSTLDSAIRSGVMPESAARLLTRDRCMEIERSRRNKLNGGAISSQRRYRADVSRGRRCLSGGRAGAGK